MRSEHQALSNEFDAARQGKQPDSIPPKPKSSPPISVRLSHEERAKLEAAAQGTSLSAHIRSCLFGENVTPRKTRKRAPNLDQVALARVLGRLGETRIANNLNQLAKASHIDQLEWNDPTRQEIEQAYQFVRDMRDDLIRALGLIDGDQS